MKLNKPHFYFRVAKMYRISISRNHPKVQIFHLMTYAGICRNKEFNDTIMQKQLQNVLLTVHRASRNDVTRVKGLCLHLLNKRKYRVN